MEHAGQRIWRETIRPALPAAARGVSIVALLALAFCSPYLRVISAAEVDSAEQRAGLKLFESKIRPVLVANCYECHAKDSKEIGGHLLLDSRPAMLAGGESGPAIVPGKPDESLLLSALRHEDFEMPPKGKLPAEVIADFQHWIELGAIDPRDGTAPAARESIDYAAARERWAFQVPRRHDPLQVQRGDWPRDDLDRFLLAKLEAADIEPAPDAERGVLLRRVYFDLIGLPPTPEELQAFLAHDSPEALAQVVDRLLASPRYAERWARHWLDVARYAESAGGGRTQIFDSAWRYRDYTIASFRDDVPFDQFVREQLAGDLLSFESDEQRHRQLVATGFLSLGPKNLDDQNKENLRMDVVDEQLDTIGRAFLGMTIGCARCHDHKFDPISHRDYYALAGILRSTQTTKDANVSELVRRDLPPGEAQASQWAKYQADRDALQPRRDAIEAERKQLGVQLAELDPSSGGGIVVDDLRAEFVGQWQTSTSNPGFVGKQYLHDMNELKGKKTATFRAKLPEPGRYEVRLAYTNGANRERAAPVTVAHDDGETTIKVDQTKPPKIAGHFVSLGEFNFAAQREATVTLSNIGTSAYVIADAVAFRKIENEKPPTENARQQQRARIESLRTREVKLAKEQKQLDERLKSLDKTKPKAAQMISVAEETKIEDCRINIRGNVNNLGDLVPRGMLSVVQARNDAESETWNIPADQSGRRQLAEWIVSPSNPLATRVYVNRVWQHLMGRGLVATPDNFGATGEPPTHAELLDTLAVDFVEQGQSTKRLIRRIVLSRAYQLATHADAKSERLDPRNTLHWRAERRRLDAEALRDSMLALAGNLDLTVGGPTIRPGTDNELAYKFDETRRGIYLPIFRNNLHEMLAVFDVANPNLVVGDRGAGNLPTQALFLLNSPFAMEQAEGFAAQLLKEPATDDAARLDRAYQRALSRPPTESERTALLAYLEQHLKGDTNEAQRLTAWSRICQTLFASVDFRYLK